MPYSPMGLYLLFAIPLKLPFFRTLRLGIVRACVDPLRQVRGALGVFSRAFPL